MSFHNAIIVMIHVRTHFSISLYIYNIYNNNRYKIYIINILNIYIYIYIYIYIIHINKCETAIGGQIKLPFFCWFYDFNSGHAALFLQLHSIVRSNDLTYISIATIVQLFVFLLNIFTFYDVSGNDDQSTWRISYSISVFTIFENGRLNHIIFCWLFLIFLLWFLVLLSCFHIKLLLKQTLLKNFLYRVLDF